MTGRNRLLTLIAAGLFATAPAAAQIDAPNPFNQPRTERLEHPRPGRDHAWRMERQSGRLQWRGNRMERRGERWERHGRWMARRAHPVRGRALARRGNRWEHRGERLQRDGVRLDRPADRLRYRHWRDRRHRRQDGEI